MVWGSFLIAAAALKTLTRTVYNAQGVKLTFLVSVVFFAQGSSTWMHLHWRRDTRQQASLDAGAAGAAWRLRCGGGGA